jgi:superfamily II DNA or RNA helicase
VILDECHRWAYKLKSCRHILNWFGENPNSRRLGLTATPERGDKTSLRRILPEVASDYRLYDLDGGPCAVLDGWAVAYDQRFITVEGVDFKNLRDVRGDFDDNQLDEILSEDNKTLIGMVQATLDLVENRRTIIFCPTVDFAKRTAKTINAKLQDYRAAVELDGAVPDQARKDVYKRHQRGEFQFLCVCGLCREGYNDPGIQAVAIYRPTKSRGLAEQMKGRGCRPLRGVVDGLSTPEQRLAAIAASDKPNCMIIDLVGVTGLADCASTAHILASGKPDEVIERANQNALRKNGPCNMADEIKKAESELAAEKVERDTQLRLRQLREEEELRKLGKLVTDVRYSQQKVQIGGGGSVQSRAGRVRMLFGKHKGKPLDQVPTGYLQWIAKEAKTKPWFKQACKNELDSRLGKEQHGHRTLDVDYVNRLLREP